MRLLAGVALNDFPVVDDVEALALALPVGADIGLDDGTFEPLEAGGGHARGKAGLGTYDNRVRKRFRYQGVTPQYPRLSFCTQTLAMIPQFLPELIAISHVSVFRN
jgi:hypothetical protein